MYTNYNVVLSTGVMAIEVNRKYNMQITCIVYDATNTDKKILY